MKIEATDPGDPTIAELKRKALLRLADMDLRRSRSRLLVVKPNHEPERTPSKNPR